MKLRKKVIDTITCNCYFLNARYWENIFEEVRKLKYNDLPSRKKCIYVCEGIEELSFWYEKLTLESGNQKAIIYELELELDEKKIFKCDAKILELGILPDKDIEDEANKYWSGLLNDNSEIENLYTGRVKILKEYNTIEEILSPPALQSLPTSEQV